MAGYSGTPLARKLGLKDGSRTAFENVPEDVRATVESYGAALVPVEAGPGTDAILYFTKAAGPLPDRLAAAVEQIRPNGFIWVAWPKRASKVPTDMTEDVVRDHALPLGLVDVKVCAVDAVWSGLKLMIRKELR